MRLPGRRRADGRGVAQHAGGVPRQVRRLVGVADHLTERPRDDRRARRGREPVRPPHAHAVLEPVQPGSAGPQPEGLVDRDPPAPQGVDHLVEGLLPLVVTGRAADLVPVVDVALHRLDAVSGAHLDQRVVGYPSTEQGGERDRVDGHLGTVEDGDGALRVEPFAHLGRAPPAHRGPDVPAEVRRPGQRPRPRRPGRARPRGSRTRRRDRAGCRGARRRPPGWTSPGRGPRRGAAARRERTPARPRAWCGRSGSDGSAAYMYPRCTLPSLATAVRVSRSAFSSTRVTGTPAGGELERDAAALQACRPGRPRAASVSLLRSCREHRRLLGGRTVALPSVA